MSFNKNMFTLLNKDAVLVVVHYYDTTMKVGQKAPSYKELTYKALRQQNIQVGDRVVVQMGERTYVKTVREILPVSELDDGIEYKWVIARVDASLYHQVVEKERQFNAKLLQLARENEAKKLRDQLSSELGEEGVALLADMTVIEGTATPVSAELPEDSDSSKE